MVESSAVEALGVQIDRDRAVTVSWADGHQSTYELADLRRRCPCAHCHELRQQGRPVAVDAGESLQIAGAELTGAWGLALAWSDRHNTGVYRWDVLRSWCACPTCRPEVTSPG